MSFEFSRERCTAKASLSVCHAPNFGSRHAQGDLEGRNFHPVSVRYVSACSCSSEGILALAAAIEISLSGEVIENDETI